MNDIVETLKNKAGMQGLAELFTQKDNEIKELKEELKALEEDYQQLANEYSELKISFV